jgi:hypothetical protein
MTNGHEQSPDLSSSNDFKRHHKSPLYFLTGNGSSEAVRELHVSDALSHFFGME